MPRNEEKALCKVGPIGVRVTLWILSFIGFVLSCLAISSCRFAKVSIIYSSGSMDVEFAGIFNFLSSSRICMPYSLLESLPTSPDASSSIKAARAFGVLAALVGGVMSIWMLVSIAFTGTNKPLWITMASLLVTSAAFQLITFIAFNDEQCKDDNLALELRNCSIDEGSAFAISAVLFYLLSGIIMFFVYPPRVPLIGFEEGWRGGTATGGNAKMAHTTVAVHQAEQAVPNVSSTSPPMESAPMNENLLNAGASVSVGVAEDEDERSGTLSSVDVAGRNKFGVEL